MKCQRTHTSSSTLIDTGQSRLCQLRVFAKSLYSLRSFHILNENPELAKHFSLVLYDNSPLPQTLLQCPPLFPTHYVHDPSNGGLASAYNFALAARRIGRARMAAAARPGHLANAGTFFSNCWKLPTLCTLLLRWLLIVPKLLVNGNLVYSPAIHLHSTIAASVPGVRKSCSQNFVGVSPAPMSSDNSGSTFRISALRSVGGFPAEFWLDFLDHASL